ncbi:LppX_LprAFG lipoprotein [Streptomyces sp. NBC_01808]|uniref:LppX_LprAFG lipoprotein n=1 Tax=Streptomyces sp. NBC_01808 TaxID=2975947 RepID=UPI002DDC8B97|nr:LppX_LprAFG lipoprotein [Streptomyces sp. NBC_01808]WSA39870.1 LppX_LprAFG lipoprotein [Streptomyces sp. NBC_01808]
MTMHSTFVRGGVALGAAALALTAFTACSDDGGDGKADGRKGGNAGQPVDVTPAAAVRKATDNAEKLTSLTYRMDSKVPGEGVMSGTGSMSTDPPAMEMKMTVKGATAADSGEMEIRLVDDAAYMKPGEEAAAGMGGKTWIKLGMAGAAARGEDPLLELDPAVENPTGDAQMMTAAEDLKEVGEEEIAGVGTTRYTGTVTLDDLRAELKDEDAETKKDRQEKIDEMAELGVDDFTMDMWIDGEDRTKQFRMQAETKEGPLDTTMTFLSYNEPVTVEAPPASETTDVSGATQESEGGA